MGYLKINLEDELLNKFKSEVIKRYGYFKGALSIAGREGNFNVSVSAYKKFFQIKM
jgi:hypothetical protein